MPNRLHFGVLLGLSAFIWWLVLVFRGTPVSLDHLTPFSIVLGFLVVGSLAFEHLLWHQPWLHGWFVKRPDLRGTWHVVQESDWVDEKTGEQVPPWQSFMAITQTFSTLQMHLMTPESQSWLVADRIRISPKGNGYQVIGVYANKPDMLLRGTKSERHEGTFVLETHGPSNRPTSLSGDYWSERKTVGTMKLTRRRGELFTEFAEAKAAFGKSGTTG